MGNRVATVFVSACAALFFAGCAGITVSKAPALDDNVGRQGAPWNLAMTRFTVTITRAVTGCGADIKANVETLASASTTLDPDQRYLLTSNGWFATSDIKSTLSSAGYNTALNAETADATAAVIGNVIGTASQVALAFAAAGGAGGNATNPPKQICTKELATAVDTLYPKDKPPLKKVVDDAIATLAQRTVDLAVRSAKVTADGNDVDLKAALIKAIDEQEAARKDLLKQQEIFSSALKASTNIQTVIWPEQPTDFATATPFTLDPDVRDKWLIKAADGPKTIQKLNVYLALHVQPATGGWVQQKEAAAADLKLGIPVRLPRAAKLIMCTEDPCPQTFATGEPLGKNRTSADFAVLQSGPIYMLPIAGGAFRSESAAITLDANGVPSVLQTIQKVAAASALTGAAKDAATQLAALPVSLRAAELANTKAETEQISADIALQTALQTAGLQGQTSTLTAQTNLINAQIANTAAQQSVSLQGMQQKAGSLNTQVLVLQAQAALAKAQADGQVVDPASALGAQTTLINAQTTLLNAAAALVKAQMSAATSTP